MLLEEEPVFSLQHFEGPLYLLLHLIQRQEVDISHISIQNLIEQFLEKLEKEKINAIYNGSEFIKIAAYLIWFKSYTLLPRFEKPQELKEEDPRFEIIHHLLDYYRVKEEAKSLTKREEQQQLLFYRSQEYEYKKPIGIDHISLEELFLLFQEMIQKAPPKLVIQEEGEKLIDQIQNIRFLLQNEPMLYVETLFTSNKSRLELIVLFLAILELMKIGEIKVGQDRSDKKMVIMANKEE